MGRRFYGQLFWAKNLISADFGDAREYGHKMRIL